MKSVLFFLLAVLFIGTIVPGCSSDEHKVHEGEEAKATIQKDYYTCPMHPSVISDRPGACPVCGMALVRKSAQQEMSADETAHLQAVSLSPTQRVLANVTTEPVLRRSFQKEITVVGMVDYAEPLQATVSARFRGRIERLFVNVTGITVRAGEPLLELYSPDLVSAKQDFLLALAATQGEKNIGSLQSQLLKATRDRLQVHFGMTEGQIRELEETGTLSSVMRFHSPIKGTVTFKQVQEGQYVDEGMVLYQLVDLSTVWVYADVYEKDLRFLKTGQSIQVKADSYPGETFHGKITFIDPVVSDETRTVRVRAEFSNPAGKLKPRMFVRGEVLIPVTRALVVPVSAVLSTGRRTVVWVETQPNTFEPRDVSLGVASNSFYEVLNGLREGELVAASGGFLIDSESALRSPQQADPHAGHGVTRKTSEPVPLSEGIIRIVVKGKYMPDVVRVRKDVPVRFEFFRDEASACTDEVIFEDFGVRQKLAAHKTTIVEFTPTKEGSFSFTCGMKMVHGTLIVEK